MSRWLFGKMPALGDFVARGLDQKARERLDAWLSQEIEAARVRWGDGFDARYDAAPAWTFVHRDGDAWHGGALCASLDRAGRRFPLVAAAPAKDAAAAAMVGTAWIGAMYEAFGAGWEADALFDATLAPAPAAWQPSAPEWALVGEDGPALRLAGAFPAGVVAGMLEYAA